MRVGDERPERPQFLRAVYISVSNDAKVQAMLREQRLMVEEWGESVTEPPAPRKKRPQKAAA